MTKTANTFLPAADAVVGCFSVVKQVVSRL